MSGNGDTARCGDTQPTSIHGGSLPAEVTAGVVRYLPELRAFARSLALNAAAADDLAQGAILRALAAAHQFRPGTNFKAWIFTILRNSYFNERRKLGRERSSIDWIAPEVEPRMAPPQDTYLEVCDVRRAFGRLRPHQREVLILVGPGGLSYEEAARISGCQLGTLKSRISRARRDLIDMLEEPPCRARKDVPSVVGRFAGDLLDD